MAISALIPKYPLKNVLCSVFTSLWKATAEGPNLASRRLFPNMGTIIQKQCLVASASLVS